MRLQSRRPQRKMRGREEVAGANRSKKQNTKETESGGKRGSERWERSQDQIGGEERQMTED